MLDTYENDGNKVVAQLLGQRATPLLYAKHMAKHKVGLENALFKQGVHIVSICPLPWPPMAFGPCALLLHTSCAPLQACDAGAARYLPHTHTYTCSCMGGALGGSMTVAMLRNAVCPQLLVREPYGVLQSFSKVLQPTQQELGYTVRHA